jgi:pyridoxamine 5'-phosphate oxidase
LFPRDPIKLFQKWFAAAARAQPKDPNAMTLATATRSGKPSARLVLLKSVDQAGFVFFTNYESRKGRELAENSRAALVFYWPSLDRQVRVNGRVRKVSAQESDEYFATRALGSRFAASISNQSRPIASRVVLEKKMAQIAARYPAGDPPRPKQWGGYRVQPEEIEFWEQRPNRLHERVRYRRARGGKWTHVLLAP